MLLGFRKQFAPKILDGSKKFTIRNPRRRSPKIGETLYMYTGLRTKAASLITSEHTLNGVQKVDIFIENQVYTENKTKGKYSIGITIGGRSLDLVEINYFVKCDGFENLADFRDYWIKEKGEKTDYFQQGHKKPMLTIWRAEAKDLTMYHWTDLRF